MDHILASDAGWAMMQADCHRFMEFLVDMNNDMARDPDCDFFVFRAAADGIVRDQIDRRLAQPSVCTLRTPVFDVARHVWMAANPCTFTLVHSLAPRVGVAPVLTQQQSCFRLHFPTPACARQRFAWLHSSSWKASCPTSTAELVSVRCANTSKPIWSANTNWTSFSMTRSSQPRQSAFRSLTTTWSATKPSSRKQSDRQKAWYQKKVREEMGLGSSQFAPSQATTISGPQAKRQKITATSTGSSSPAPDEQSSPAQTQEQALPLTAGLAALQELRDHVRARFVLTFDDAKTEEQDMDHILAMNPNAVGLLKAVFDRVIGTDRKFIGEFGCLVCIATMSEETFVTIEGLERLVSCRKHGTDDESYCIFRLRHRKSPSGTSRRI